MPLKLIPPGGRKGYGVYYIRGSYRCHRIEVSTKTKDKRIAEGIKTGIEKRIDKEEDSKPERGKTKTLGDAVSLYIAARNPCDAEIKKLNRIKAKYGSRVLTEIVPSDLQVMAREMYADMDVKTSTMNRMVIRPAAAVLHLMAEDNIIPYMRIRKLDEDTPPPRRPDEGVIEALLAVAKGDKHDFLTFLYVQGWRLSEAISLRWEYDGKDSGSYLDLQRRILWVYTKKGKRRGWKSVPMSDVIFEMLANWPQEKEKRVWRWPSRYSAQRWLNKLCKEAEVHITFHQFRHEFASSHREAGASPRDLTKIGTWVNERSTAVYDHASFDSARELLKRRGVKTNTSPTPETRGKMAK